MMARGEFAYLVAATARDLDFMGGPETMMREEVYAAVIWALVMATVCAPIMFKWALKVFDRSIVTHRSVYIGGDEKKHQKQSFVIRMVGKYFRESSAKSSTHFTWRASM